MKPFSLKVKGKGWTVIPQPGLKADLRYEKRRPLAGRCMIPLKTILINTKQSKREIAMTLVHEHGHAILHEYRLRGNNRNEELVVVAMEEIATTIRRNPAYRAILLDGIGGTG